jgi:hypothetical protein
MVATRPPRGVERRREQVPQRHVEGSGQSQTDLARRVDPVADPTRPGSGHGDDWETGHTGSHDLGNEIGEWGQAPILEAVDKVPGHTFVMEGGNQSDAAVQDPLPCRPEVGPATRAEKAGTTAVTSLAEHPGDDMGRR